MDYKKSAEQYKKAADYWEKNIPEYPDVMPSYRFAYIIITDLLARAEAAEARAEKAERERDAAVSDLETIMAYGGGNLDTCQFCKNGQCYARGGTKLCLPEWRGIKEE